MSDANPPGGVNLTIAIFALVGAVFSIVGFIVHYSPRHQYGDFCSILHDINDIFADYELLSLLPSDQGSRLYQRYRRHVHALLTTSRLPRVASTDVVSNTVFLLIWNHFVIWSQYHPTCWYFMFGQLWDYEVSEEVRPSWKLSWSWACLLRIATLVNWCYSIFVGSLPNRERQKNPEDYGDVSLSNFNHEQDPSSNYFKCGQWLRMPTSLISKEVRSFLISFFWWTLAGDPQKCFCRSQDSDEAETSLYISLMRFFVVRRFVHVDFSAAVVVHSLFDLNLLSLRWCNHVKATCIFRDAMASLFLLCCLSAVFAVFFALHLLSIFYHVVDLHKLMLAF